MSQLGTERHIAEIITIGAGNWGLALASLFSRSRPTRVWTIDRALADSINANRQCPGVFYPHPVPSGVVVEEKYSSPCQGRDTLFIIAVPSSQVAAAARELAEHVKEPLVLCVSKGFDAHRVSTMSQLIEREIPEATVAVLTGPTIANEVAVGKPTCAVLASRNLVQLAMIKQVLANPVIAFRISPDPVQHEVCAALKGLVALAVGMAWELDLGANAVGVLMTEGIAEMAAVASFFGTPQQVAYGISGAGDLLTTCISPDSRNRRLGVLMAQGVSLEEALDQVGMTVEGVAMSETITTLWSLDVSIPLINLANDILRNGPGENILERFRKLIASAGRSR